LLGGANAPIAPSIDAPKLSFGGDVKSIKLTDAVLGCRDCAVLG
jgi:hypothetical protein